MEYGTYQRLLVPCDGSAPSLAGFDEAVKLARLCKAEVRVVHVIDELLVATGFEQRCRADPAAIDGARADPQAPVQTPSRSST